MSVRTLANTDIDTLTPLLKQAFAADPELRWVIPDPTEWDRIAGPWFKLNLKSAITMGHGLTDVNRRGVSLWEPPGLTHSLLSQCVTLWRMALMFRGNLARAIQIQASMERFRPTGAFWNLTFIATEPRYQGTGIGRALIAPMLALADQQRLPVFLECSNVRNIPFYHTQGFKLIATVRLPEGPTIWPMMREAA